MDLSHLVPEEEVEVEEPQDAPRRRGYFDTPIWRYALIGLGVLVILGLLFLVINAAQRAMLPQASNPNSAALVAPVQANTPTEDAPAQNTAIPQATMTPFVDANAKKTEVVPAAAAPAVDPPAGMLPLDAIHNVGTGADIITGFADTKLANPQIVIYDTVKSNPFDGADPSSAEDTRVLYCHSEKAAVSLKDAAGKEVYAANLSDKKQSFILVALFGPGYTLTINGVPYNAATNHKNSWCEMFAAPKGSDLLKAARDEFNHFMVADPTKYGIIVDQTGKMVFEQK